MKMRHGSSSKISVTEFRHRVLRRWPSRARRTQPGDFRLDRASVVQYCIAGLIAVIASRAVVLALFPAQKVALQHIADNQYQRDIELAPYRGTIFDQRGEALAISVRRPSLAINPHQFHPTAAEISRLAHLLKIPAAKIRQLAKRKGYFVWIARQQDPKVVEQVLKLGLSGILQLTEPARFYPAGNAAAHLLGFISLDNTGLAGIERQLDKELRGQPFKVTASKDARGNFIFSETAGAMPEKMGNSVYLTIDKVVQEIAEDELAAGVKAAGAVRGFAIVSDPHTGRILALANYPTFDPNSSRSASVRDTRNSALVDTFEPGSIVKPFIIGTAIERKITKPQEMHDCDGGSLEIGRHIIHDTHGAEALSTADTLIRSSNICTYKIAAKMGRQATHEALINFGIGARSSLIGFPGEVGGRLSAWQQWANIRFANVAFGHGFLTTGLEMVQAMGALANGGHLMQPALIGRVVSSDGLVVRSTPTMAVRAVVSPATARVMRELLQLVVTDPHGTGRKAMSPLYTTAGKTGTAQKVDPGLHGYAKGKYIASFVGFAPVADPHLVIYVMIDEPGEKHYYGGDAAAPVFAHLAERSLKYLNVAPDIQVTNDRPLAPEGAPKAPVATKVGGHGSTSKKL